MDALDIERRFSYHPPSNSVVSANHSAVRTQLLSAAMFLNKVLPEGREKSLAITALEECMMWGTAAIARNQK